MTSRNFLIHSCFVPFLCVLPVFGIAACTADDVSNAANQGVQAIGQSIQDLSENARIAAPYVKEDLQTLWNTIAGSMEVYGDRIGVSPQPPQLAEAREARERLIAGASFDEVARKAMNELTPQDLEQMPVPDLSCLNGILPFEIDLSACGENLAEVLNNLDIGQVSAILRSEAGYHLIQLIDRHGAKVKIGHIVFQVDPAMNQAEPDLTGAAEVPAEMKEAVERLASALNKR